MSDRILWWAVAAYWLSTLLLFLPANDSAMENAVAVHMVSFAALILIGVISIFWLDRRDGRRP